MRAQTGIGLIVVILLTVGACHKPVRQDVPAAPSQDLPSGATRVVGTVRHFEVEGGFWAVRGDDGVTYDPMNGLPSRFQRDGLRVSMIVKVQKDLVGTHMVGPIVEIIQIDPL